MTLKGHYAVCFKKKHAPRSCFIFLVSHSVCFYAVNDYTGCATLIDRKASASTILALSEAEAEHNNRKKHAASRGFLATFRFLFKVEAETKTIYISRHFRTFVGRQPHRGCRGHIPAIYWLGDIKLNMPPILLLHTFGYSRPNRPRTMTALNDVLMSFIHCFVRKSKICRTIDPNPTESKGNFWRSRNGMFYHLRTH